MNIRLVRSVLYSPADRIKILQKAIILKPDVIVIDLEDAVTPTKKLFARDNIIDFINSLNNDNNSNNNNNVISSLTIRVNCPKTSEYGKDDLDFISKIKQTDKIKINAIIIPKVDDIDTINYTVDIMNKNGMHNINIWTMIETAKGVLNVENIAKSDHVKAIVFGMNDLTKDLRAKFVSNNIPLLYSMSRCIVAARAYDKIIIDGVFMDINDNKGLLEDCIRGRELGFDGKSLIHPNQIETTNSIYSPSIEEINHSKRIIESYNNAISEGKSVAVLDGKLIEYLHVIIAQDIIDKSNIISKLC